MADLLPSIPESPSHEEVEPRVVGLDEDEADDVFGALSSETARDLFATLNRDPAHPSALAESVDTSLQNAQYHLEKLEDAGLVEVVDTAYSAKGREMDIYAPADRPLVVFAGDDEEQSLLRSALSRLLGGWGVIAGIAVVVQGLFGGEHAGDGLFTFGSSGEAADTTEDAGGELTSTDGTSGDVSMDDGAAVDDQTGSYQASEDAVIEITDRTAEQGQPAVETVGSVADDLTWIGDALAVAGLEPGVALFTVGSGLLALGVGFWYVHRSAA